METESLDHFSPWALCVSWAANLAMLIVGVPLLTLLVSWLNSLPPFSRNRRGLKRATSVPYYLPYVGHGLELAIGGPEFFLRNMTKFGRANLHKIVIPGLDQLITSGSSHVSRVFLSKDMSMNEAHSRAMERPFGMTPSAVAFYKNDDSGYGSKVLPGSKVRPENRILLRIHHLVQANLSGSSLQTITAQFQRSLADQLLKLTEIGEDWVHIDDLTAFMRTQIMTAALTSMFGPYLTSLNPKMVEEFWQWQSNIGPLYMGLPRWLIPKAYSERDKLLGYIMRWHSFAHQHFDVNDIGDESADWEPYFGSRFSRRRQHAFGQFDFMDARAAAAEDLSFIWASNANSGFAAIWFMLELLCDRKLMARVQNEISAAALSTAPSADQKAAFDIEKLCLGPVCQSIYAEVLRLRVAIMVSRKAQKDLDFDGWDVKRGERVCIVSTNEAQDETVWNSGTESDPHPLNTFWADRFLIYPGDTKSGPLKPSHRPSPEISDQDTESKTSVCGSPKFSLKGLNNSWIPFSGGVRFCPGRHFAKQEMISTVAMMLTNFDIELETGPGWEKPDSDLSYFGFGTMPPKGSIPCKIRRRKI